MAQFLMILYAQTCRGSKKQSFAQGDKRCIKNEFEGYINWIKILQFIQLISSALPLVQRLFSSFTNKTAPITTKPTVLHYGQKHTFFSVSNELFFKVKDTVGVGSLHRFSYVQLDDLACIYILYISIIWLQSLQVGDCFNLRTFITNTDMMSDISQLRPVVNFSLV